MGFFRNELGDITTGPEVLLHVFGALSKVMHSRSIAAGGRDRARHRSSCIPQGEDLRTARRRPQQPPHRRPALVPQVARRSGLTSMATAATTITEAPPVMIAPTTTATSPFAWQWFPEACLCILTRSFGIHSGIDRLGLRPSRGQALGGPLHMSAPSLTTRLSGVLHVYVHASSSTCVREYAHELG